MISIKNLSAGYGQTKVLHNFSLNLEQGNIYALIGPSGCGKSTLLKVLCGIIYPVSGSIEHNGKAISKHNCLNIGYVPQNYGLLPWKTVRENIRLPMKVGIKKERRREENEDIVNALGLTELLQRYPKELSGGQKQRVALARAFISQPDLLLMDEPFSALDAFTSDASQQIFLNLWQKYKVTTLFITHNMLEAATMGQHILLMNQATRNIAATFNNASFGTGVDANIANTAAQIKKMFKEMLT
ncbi:ABC transporter ATP-binding protein [Desulfovibrio sp. OttesenSCG-928-F07]|nr:ABC transporter ATP-binding protein [Desulfovibrio sp. OttesenSCG-928-F07]